MNTSSRTAQKDNAGRTFGEWAKPDDEFEQSFKDFPIAFNHPHHGGPVFNISDPPHLIKKLVNSLWYSDMETKDRKLGKFWPQPTTGELEWCEFSLRTLEKVYFNEELGGGALSRAEQAAMLQRFSSMKPDQFKRDSRSCMDVGLSMKVCQYRRRKREPKCALPTAHVVQGRTVVAWNFISVTSASMCRVRYIHVYRPLYLSLVIRTSPSVLFGPATASRPSCWNEVCRRTAT